MRSTSLWHDGLGQAENLWANLSLFFGVILLILETLIHIEPPFAFNLWVEGSVCDGADFCTKIRKK